MSCSFFSNKSQLVLRNSDALPLHSGRLLMIAPPSDGLASTLLSEGSNLNLLGLTSDYSAYSYLKPLWRNQECQKLIYGAVLPREITKPFDGVLLFLQKSKLLMNFWLDMISVVLSIKGKVWIVGENSEGIKSWRKSLTHRFYEVTSIDNARHCVLIEASSLVKHIKSFSRDDYFYQFKVSTNNIIFSAFSLPGVFSCGRLDRGTNILLDTLRDIKANNILDFGCGAGIIATYLALMLPKATVTLVDCDALAIDSSQKTLIYNNIANYQLLANNGISEVSGNFDLIISNPPFHQGVKTHYEVTDRFLRQSRELLINRGELRVVANSFLKYETIIKEIFGNCTTLVVKEGFSVYSAINLV